MARALRKGPYQTNLLLGGCDVVQGSSVPSLYFIDYLSALAKVNYGAHGYAANFILSVLDRDWRTKMNLEEGLDVIKKCIKELNTRFLISQPKFIVKIVDQNGIRVVEI